MKPIIAIDLDGAILKHRPFKKAHEKWFEVMAFKLKDPSIKKYSKLKNYFPKIHEIMKRFLGKVSKEKRLEYMRNLYAELVIAEVKKKDVIDDFLEYLISIKKKYRLVLISTTPGVSIAPIIKKIGCSNLFYLIYKSPSNKEPNKREMFKSFIKKYGKIKFYIGDGDEHIKICKELKIPCISVNWVDKARFKGDYNIKTVGELDKILR